MTPWISPPNHVYRFLDEGGGASNGIGPPDSLTPVDLFVGADAPPNLTDIVCPSFREKSCLGAAGVLDDALLSERLVSSFGARCRLRVKTVEDITCTIST